MHCPKVWILTFLLVQVVALITPSWAERRIVRRKGARVPAWSRLYDGVQRNRQTMMRPPPNGHAFLEKNMYLNDDMPLLEIKKEHKLPLPSGALFVQTTPGGLEEHAYFLAYKMSRSEWKEVMNQGKTKETYLSVLDPLRVYKVYGPHSPSMQYFMNDIALHTAIDILTKTKLSLTDKEYAMLRKAERKGKNVKVEFLRLKEGTVTLEQPQPSSRQRINSKLLKDPEEAFDSLQMQSMVSMEEVQQYVEAKEPLRPLPTGKEKIIISEKGLLNHGYFLSYKMPRPVWNQWISSHHSINDYLQVLDPERVQAVHGKKKPDVRVFKYNQGLYNAIRKLTPNAVDEPFDIKEGLKQLVEKDPRYTFPPNNEEVKETQLEDVLREISSQASTLEETSDTEQQDTSNQFRALPLSTTEKKPMESEQQSEALISTDTTTQEPINRQRRKDSVDYLKQIRDPFQLGLYLSYVVNENEYKKELQKAKEIDGSQSKWEEILDPLRVKEYYLYGPGTVVSEVFDEDPGLFEAINTVLVNYYETTSLPEQDPAILDKYPPVTTPVDPNRKFKDPLELAQYLSLQISMEELRELIAKAKTEGTLRQLWLSILNQDRVKNYFYQGKNLFFIERFQRHKDLFFAMRDHKLLPPVR